jgi:2-keto-4-pentenoate hydratase/2-oxohepta-3-ene-1,7-dioic acid hydratase in catechol pathway
MTSRRGRCCQKGDLQFRPPFNGPSDLVKLGSMAKQDANTRDMIWSLAEQIAAISEYATLE